MNIKRDANKREKVQARSLDMTRCAGSGSFLHKGDMRDDTFLIDSKFTYNNTQITIKRKDLEKIDTESYDYNPPRKSAMLISINGFERMVITLEDYKEYRQLLSEKLKDKGEE